MIQRSLSLGVALLEDFNNPVTPLDPVVARLPPGRARVSFFVSRSIGQFLIAPNS